MSNPAFDFAKKNSDKDIVIDGGSVMTINGTLQVTAFMGILMMLSAYFTWSKLMAGYTDFASALMFGGLIVGFIVGLIIAFTRLPMLVPIYAVSEGLFLGGISAVMETSYPGIVSMAVVGTFSAFFTMLILYRLGLIRNTDKFRGVIFVSTASVAVIYLVDFIGHFFGYAVPGINSSSNFGILFSLVVIAIAALNLIIDFDFIEQGERRMLPKSYEWYGAFGLMVTVVWLYIEILKLLAKFQRR